MALLLADCPRCGSKHVTFDVLEQNLIGQEHGWVNINEVFGVCRHCHKSTIFIIRLREYTAREKLVGRKLVEYQNSLNDFFEIQRYVSLRDMNVRQPPDFLDAELDEAFREGATCFSVGCYNASAAMFRRCIGLVTLPLLPDVADTGVSQPNSRQRRDLGLRMQWLFDNGILSPTLKELAQCIREDGNDGAHSGSLSKEDAEDVMDFTHALLDRLVTEPKKLEQAELRRKARRNSTAP